MGDNSGFVPTLMKAMKALAAHPVDWDGFRAAVREATDIIEGRPENTTPESDDAA